VIIALMMSCFPVAVAGAPPLPYITVGPGLQYRHERIDDVPWAIHILKVDRSQQELELVTTLAHGTIFGLTQLSTHVACLLPDAGTPVAAVNGDFYVLRDGPYQGDPRGVQILNGELVSEPTGVSFWLDSSRGLHLGEVHSQLRVVWPDGQTTLVGLNREREATEAVLYTPSLGDETRAVGGRELVLEADGGCWLPLRVGQRCTGQVTEIRNNGSTILRPDMMVLSMGRDMLPRVGAVQAGDRLDIIAETEPSLDMVETAIGGGPVLMHHGEVSQWEQPGSRHPRTAIGWNDTHLFLVVVDGRQPLLSVGMTFPELAALMQILGCTEAMNLDGGGSSTFWLAGTTLNSCSDGQERGIANALVLVRRPGNATTSSSDWTLPPVVGFPGKIPTRWGYVKSGFPRFFPHSGSE
jgi:hypothetical protein